MSNVTGTLLTELDSPRVLDLLVRLGLAYYSRNLDVEGSPLALLQREGQAAARATAIELTDWTKQISLLQQAWNGSRGPLRRFADQWALTQADLFLVGLCAACESRRAAALGVMTLQSPLGGARPSVHLALDLMEQLFDAGPGDALQLADGPLVTSGLIDLPGDDALPQRTLTIRVPLWRILTGGPRLWPGGCLLPPAAAPDAATNAFLARTAEAIVADTIDGIVLRGPPGSGRSAIATSLAERLGRRAIEIPMSVLRDDRGFASACHAAEWMPVLRLNRDAGDLTIQDFRPIAVLAGPHGCVQGERLIQWELAPPAAAERARLWRAALGTHTEQLPKTTLDGALLYPAAIAAVGRTVCLHAQTEQRAVTSTDLREARLALAPQELARLAHPVPRAVGGDALIAGPALAADLASLLARCRCRESIWQGMGPSLAASATRGVRALFAGESGTGKTMAAAYIATELSAPLYRCDLGAVMNKYIGESEKNLGALLDYAEAGDVVLLFDEADSLFGRRSEASETGERYANMLTNFLLTRLEAHHGIVILTTNSKARIDPAFWRRLDQVIDFPNPGYQERLALWRSHLGRRAPPDAVLEKLAAYCDLAGGSVRNAVLAAAATAAANAPIGLDRLSPALQREYTKLRRTPPAALAQTMRLAE